MNRKEQNMSKSITPSVLTKKITDKIESEISEIIDKPARYLGRNISKQTESANAKTVALLKILNEMSDDIIIDERSDGNMTINIESGSEDFVTYTSLDEAKLCLLEIITKAMIYDEIAETDYDIVIQACSKKKMKKKVSE